MSMFETTRYVNNTNKKRVVNLIVPTHLTECTIKLPETLRLDKVTDVYLDGVTDLAGETTECFEEPIDLADGSSISVKKNNRNFGMDGNKEDNAQLMVIKIDELEMKNMTATGSAVENEDNDFLNSYNSANGTSITNPSDLPKFWHKQSDGTFGTSHINTNALALPSSNIGGFGSGPQPGSGVGSNHGNDIFIETIDSSNTGRPPILDPLDPYLTITNTSQTNTTDPLPAAAQTYDFAAATNPNEELLEALKVYYEYTVSRYERYRWFIHVGKHFMLPASGGTENIKYHPTSDTFPSLGTELDIIATQETTGEVGSIPTPTTTQLNNREAIYNEVLIGREIYNALLERYQIFRKIEREWYERVQRYEYSLVVSSTMSKAIVVPNSKSTRISDEFMQNNPIRGDNNNLSNRLTPFQLSTYEVSRHNDPSADNRPFSFSQSEYTVNKSEGGYDASDNRLGEWVVPDYGNRNINSQMSIKGYDKRGVHTHRLNKFNFVSTINPKSIDSFKVNYGFLKTRVLGIARDNYFGRLSPVWDLSQGRPLGIGDYNYGEVSSVDGEAIMLATIDEGAGPNIIVDDANVAWHSGTLVQNNSQYVPDSTKNGGTRGNRLGVTDDPPFREWIGWGTGDPGVRADYTSGATGTDGENYWEAAELSEFTNSLKSELTYSKEKYPGWKNYRGGIIRPLSYDNPLNKYDDSLDVRDPTELAGRVATNAVSGQTNVVPGVNPTRAKTGQYNFARSDPPNFGIAEPDMRYSPDVGRLCITLVFIERD